MGWGRFARTCLRVQERHEEAAHAHHGHAVCAAVTCAKSSYARLAAARGVPMRQGHASCFGDDREVIRMERQISAGDGLQQLRSLAGRAPYLSAQQESKLTREVASGSQPALDRLLRAHFR